MSTFSENLKKQRQKKNLTQDQLGQLVGVTGVTIMRYEKGLREPKLETIKSIANALNVPLSELIDLNSPILSKATKRFISGNHPEENELYGDAMDELVMTSPLGSVINDYQSTIAEINSLRFELISLCYQNLDDDGKEKLYNYACDLIENSDSYKAVISKKGFESASTTE